MAIKKMSIVGLGGKVMGWYGLGGRLNGKDVRKGENGS
jgi:hypothetical protein